MKILINLSDFIHHGMCVGETVVGGMSDDGSRYEVKKRAKKEIIIRRSRNFRVEKKEKKCFILIHPLSAYSIFVIHSRYILHYRLSGYIFIEVPSDSSNTNWTAVVLHANILRMEKFFLFPPFHHTLKEELLKLCTTTELSTMTSTVESNQ